MLRGLRHNRQLEIDHIDPRQKLSHRIWSWSPARREAELGKCQVLCQKHHLEKTKLNGDIPDWGKGLKHGTRSMYNKHKCRCAECKAWNAAKSRRHRALMVERQTHYVQGVALRREGSNPSQRT